MEERVERNIGLHPDIESSEEFDEHTISLPEFIVSQWKKHYSSFGEEDITEEEETRKKLKEETRRQRKEETRKKRVEQLKEEIAKNANRIPEREIVRVMLLGKLHEEDEVSVYQEWLAHRGLKLDGTSTDAPSKRKLAQTDMIDETSAGAPPRKKWNRNKEKSQRPESEVNFSAIAEELDGTATGKRPSRNRKINKKDQNEKQRPASVLNVQDQSRVSDGVWNTLSENVENLANTCKRASEKLIQGVPSTVTKMLWEPVFIAMTILTNIVQDTPSTVTKSLWIAVMANLTNIEKDVPLTLVKRLCDCMDRIIQFAKHTVQDVQSTLLAKLSDSMVNLTAFIENILQESGKIPELISGIIQRAANTNLSDKLLSRFAGLIGKNWEILGFELGLNAVEIDHISADNKSISMAIFAMLRKWVTSKQEEAKANDLLRAMWNCKVVNVNWEGLATVFI